MKMKLVYALTCCLLGGLIIIIGYKVDDLKYQLEVSESWGNHGEIESIYWQEEYRAAERRYQELLKVPVIKEIVIEKPVDRIIEKEIEVYKDLLDFASYKELRQFVDDVGIYLSLDGECYDATLSYWRMARDKGYRVHIETVLPDEYNYWFKERRLEYGEGHIIIMTVIGRDIYWIDPSTAELVKRGIAK